ncbi:hypothetical protein [Streptomyces sp. AS02]|uniref:hypothetical protein n=1 Tax=Streptomyces sp. AS02 TaxID=2938946 RepID=UPI002021D570|nr:hypothetical protein [Streptomyces sp. AS02]MCL8011460.1 hypothetical protein [Streptomyces sp. AS02]
MRHSKELMRSPHYPVVRSAAAVSSTRSATHTKKACTSAAGSAVASARGRS